MSIKRGILKAMSICVPPQKLVHITPEIHCAQCDHVTMNIATNLQISGYVSLIFSILTYNFSFLVQNYNKIMKQSLFMNKIHKENNKKFGRISYYL